MLLNIWIVAILLFLLVAYIFAFRLRTTFLPPDYFRENEKIHKERYFSCVPYFELENVKCTVDI
jgi:hypothetical protein